MRSVNKPTSNHIYLSEEFVCFPFHHLVFNINHLFLLKRFKYIICIVVVIINTAYHCSSPTPLSHTQNIRIDILFPAEHFKVMSRNKNGSRYVVETLTKGVPEIEATLTSIIAQVCPCYVVLLNSLRGCLVTPCCGENHFLF